MTDNDSPGHLRSRLATLPVIFLAASVVAVIVTATGCTTATVRVANTGWSTANSDSVTSENSKNSKSAKKKTRRKSAKADGAKARSLWAHDAKLADNVNNLNNGKNPVVLGSGQVDVESNLEDSLSQALKENEQLEAKLIETNKTDTPTPSARGEAALSARNEKTKMKRLAPEQIIIGIDGADQAAATANSATPILITKPIPTKSSRAKANNEAHLIFDFPVTYNSRVRKWVRYFQTTGRPSFRRWLERSSRYIPAIQEELRNAGLPLDIAYVAMIESGFSSSAISHANAMGMWQFIAPTGRRYGLNVDWWIDERRDFEKATKAAIGYMSDLFDQFGSWYLVAASYNMGENGVRRLIARHKTNSFWDLADRGALPEETRNYVPKMLAAMLIAKAPALYGFRDLEFQVPFAFETTDVPGGMDLINLAGYLGVSERSLTELNPELLKGFVPREVRSHRIRIPKGSRNAVARYLDQR